MVEQVKAYIEQWNMIEPQDIVTLGVSGGADSVCLLLILEEVAKQMNFSLQVIHVEHGIRGEESLGDARFVEQLCKDRGIPFFLCPVDVPRFVAEHHLSVEEAARILRYDVFSKYAKGPIALAHHREDNVETVLFQMARGTGLDGLCGMRPVRWDEKGNKFIRPLLEQSRDAIEEFLQKHGQSFCTDSTNFDLDYSRNRIRNNILPEMEEINSQAVLHIQRTADQMGKLREYVEEQTTKEYESIVSRDMHNASLNMNVEKLLDLPDIIRERVILQALYELAEKKKDFVSAHVEAVNALLYKQSGRQLDLPYGILVYRQYDYLCLTKEQSVASQKMRVIKEVEVTGESLEKLISSQEEMLIPLGEGGERFVLRLFSYSGNSAEISTNRYTKWLDYDKIKSGFCVRKRKTGDYFLLNRDGQHKKLSDYMINEKIPATQRDAYWLICRESEVLWMIGGRMGYGAAVSEETRLVLEIVYEGGNRDGLPEETQDFCASDGRTVKSEDCRDR